MTKRLVIKWLNMVWRSWLDALCNMLVLDSFHGHMREKVKAEANKHSDIVISGWMTKPLQPLDVVINQPFKVACW
jgi:hypothetical protein